MSQLTFFGPSRTAFFSKKFRPFSFKVRFKVEKGHLSDWLSLEFLMRCGPKFLKTDFQTRFRRIRPASMMSMDWSTSSSNPANWIWTTPIGSSRNRDVRVETTISWKRNFSHRVSQLFLSSPFQKRETKKRNSTPANYFSLSRLSRLCHAHQWCLPRPPMVSATIDRCRASLIVWSY